MIGKGFWRNCCRKVGQLSSRSIRRRPVRAPRAWAAEVLEERAMLSTITVTTLTDSVTNDGQVSLREAINAANSNSSVDGSAAGDSGVQDEIVFQDGLVGTVFLNPLLGELGISETVKITGLGAADTAVDAQGNSRIFFIASTAGDVALDSMTITGGDTLLSSEHGGGISFHSSGTLSLTGSVVTDNHTAGFDADGGGIYADNGNVLLVDSTVSANSSTGLESQGGGISARVGSVTLTNSTVTGNSTLAANSEGAGIYTDTGDVTLTNSTVSNNSSLAASSAGAGIFSASGDVTLTESTVSGNSTLDAFGSGAGIFAGSGNVKLTRSTVSGNSTTGAFSRGGGIFTSTGNVELTNSTLANNSATGADADGGGIYSLSGSITLISSTVSGNSALGLGADGGGVYAYEGSITLTNSIVAGNSAHILSSGQDIFFYDYLGTAVFTATHSLIGLNGGTPLAPAPVGSPDSNGNLVGGPTSIDAINPLLKPLGNYGGPTQTMALQYNSPAINGGGTTALTTDQRGTGYARVADGALDMGAYEYQLVNTTPVSTYDATEGGRFGNLVIMTFTSPEAGAQASDFNVTVDWGASVINPVVTVELVSATSTESNWRVVATATYPAGSAAGSPYVLEVTVEDNHGFTIETTNTTIDVAAATPPVRQLERQTGLAGFYYLAGHGGGTLASVLQNGSVLTLFNLSGQMSSGSIVNGTDITATDFGLTATFDQEQGTITWSNGEVWAKVRQIDGKWLTSNGNVAGIRQLGVDLIITGGTGSKTTGHLYTSTDININDWFGISGSLTNDGQQINWSNGTVWYLIPDFQGDWLSNGGATRIEQNGTTLQFVNSVGETSTGSMVSATQVVTGANWGGLIGNIVGNSIQFTNGTTWSIPTVTNGTPELGGLWQPGAGGDSRVLQADQLLTFVNASGGASSGQFVNDTTVLAVEWNQQGTIVGDQIVWANGTAWTRVPYIYGTYSNQDNFGAGINQLERDLTFTDRYGNVTHGTLVDPTQIVETDGDQRTAVISNGVITWSNGPVWTPLPILSGNWQQNQGLAPTYVEQSGRRLIFIDADGTYYRGQFLTTTTAEMFEWFNPSAPSIIVTVVNDELLDFGSGLEWNKFPPTVLDDVFADQNFWPFV